MDLNKSLHKVSHLKWVFMIALISLLTYIFIVMPDDKISLIGITLFLGGVYLGLESLGDINKMHPNEIKRFQIPGFSTKRIQFIFMMIIVLVLISSMFMILKFFGDARNEFLFNELFNLGLDIWGLILGLLCQIRSINDKDRFANALTKAN